MVCTHHLREDRFEAETATTVQSRRSIVVEPSVSIKMREWSLILAYFFTGQTSTIFFFFGSLETPTGNPSVLIFETFSGSNTQTKPCHTKDKKHISLFLPLSKQKYAFI